MRALVVFHGTGHGRFVRFLAPGFRHCFVCIEDAHGIWVRFDGQAGLPEIRAEAPGSFDLAGFYRDAGFTVIALDDVQPRRPRTPLMLGTCVGAVKRLLGLRAPLILTPRQLWRTLRRLQDRISTSLPERTQAWTAPASPICSRNTRSDIRA